MRKAGAAPEVIKPVLAAEQESCQRQSEAKALSKLDAARNAANQAQASVETAEAAVAVAEVALAAARQRLEKAKQKHQERLAAVQSEENIAPAPNPAEAVAMATKAMKLL